MTKKSMGLTLIVAAMLLAVAALFLFSCVATLSDGQGALIFIFTIPVMGLLLGLSWHLAGRVRTRFPLQYAPKAVLIFLILFFVMLPIPVLNLVPGALLKGIGVTFEALTGKTPYVYFKDRNSFPTWLAKGLTHPEVDFGTFGVSFAWDKVCITPTDTGHRLEFFWEGKTNTVVDISKSVADFSEPEVCLQRRQAVFMVTHEESGRTILQRKN